jgi:succinate dehydrogenase/fumarate reductase cytochrome b subunit
MHALLGLLILILDIIAVVEIVKSRDDGTKKAIWIVLVVCLPVLGMVLWFFLGRKEA